MKKTVSKTEAREKIDNYFSSGRLDADKTRKIKRLAMKYKIRLGDHRKRFCKRCFSDLTDGKVRIRKTSKMIECKECGFKNRFKIV